MSSISNADVRTTGAGGAAPGEEWPLEIRALFDALSRPIPIASERRASPRTSYRAPATLRVAAQTSLFKRRRQPASTIAFPIYLRDYSCGAVSFLSPTYVAPGQKVELEASLASGEAKRMTCRVSRCRQFRDGWFEGLLTVAR